ncbi:MAG: hypothetical protein LBH31_09930 [Burkholderiaceae bacterium]|jgi:hypothetical protein|nr:hypothetical protein [Burkholderiaceae bacterium]
MEIPAPFQEIPYCGRYEMDHAHAPYMIVRSLLNLGLADWTVALLHWLGRYDGLEEHLEDGFMPDPRLDPACCVRDVLLEHVARWPKLELGECLALNQRQERIGLIIDDLLKLEFVASAAYWGRPHKPASGRVVWNSLQDDWLWFIQLGPDFAAIRDIEGDDYEHLVVTRDKKTDTPIQMQIRHMLAGESAGSGA